MKTNIRKFPAVLLLAVLCLTVFPISAMAAGVAEVKIPVSVELSGEKPSPDETYTIILQGEDEAPMPEENTITVTGAGKAEFPAVEYSVPGVYTYSVSQQPGKLENGHYDNTVYYVKVTVTNGESGDLEAVVAAHTDAQMNSEKQDIGFVNSYDPVDTPTPAPENTPTPLPEKTPTAMPTRTPAATITNTPIKPDSNPPASGTSSYTGTSSYAGNTGSSHVKAMPKTGDNTNLAKWIAVICVSGCVVLLAAVFVRRKKKTDK